MDKSPGESLFLRPCVFAAGAAASERIPPPTVPEIAFAGRSNVGKSSLLNALTGRKGLARSSNTPGRTQQINFFDLGGRLFLVDLPGVGYAAASKDKVRAWNAMVENYLRHRPTLRRVCLLVDSRHGLKPLDREALALLEDARVPSVVVLTKSDKISAAAVAARAEEVTAALRAEFSYALPTVYVTSSDKKGGISELRDLLAAEIR